MHSDIDKFHLFMYVFIYLFTYLFTYLFIATTGIPEASRRGTTEPPGLATAAEEEPLGTTEPSGWWFTCVEVFLQPARYGNGHHRGL